MALRVPRGRGTVTASLAHAIPEGTLPRWPAAGGSEALLGTYAHFLPTELQGFADELTPLDGPIRTLDRSGRATARKSTSKNGAASRGSMVGPRGIEPLTDGLKVLPRTHVSLVFSGGYI